METVLNEVEENQKILETFKIESPAKGKVSAANSSDKKSAKQSVANPAIQQQPSCRLCGAAYDPSRCPGEEAKLKAELQCEEQISWCRQVNETEFSTTDTRM